MKKHITNEQQRPYDQLSGEPALWYRRFERFRLMAPVRSISKVYLEEHPPKETTSSNVNVRQKIPGDWFHDTFSFHGAFRTLRQRTLALAQVQPGEAVLDVGCGTGTLAIHVARCVGRAGRVAGIDSGTAQIARARAKAARRGLSVEFQIGVIEHLLFHDQTFDVVFSRP